MQIVRVDDRYQLYADNMETLSKLKPASYAVKYDQKIGFYLEEYHNVEVKEKVYGVSEQKVQKVLNSFKLFNRNLGVILSGAKGIGKSLFAKLLAQAGIAQGYPLIVVNEYMNDIASFINKIDQEVIVLFDEFDKTFKEDEDKEDTKQSTLLPLFDGLSNGKKLFVVTCNEVENLNKYLLNRPGRFHYHFRFDYPTSEDIKEYMEDHLNPEYYPEIEQVIIASRRMALSYDCLRAIAFELNTGSSLEDALKDLNITNIESTSFNIAWMFEKGEPLYVNNVDLNLVDLDDSQEFNIYWPDQNAWVTIEFEPTKCEYDQSLNAIILEPENYKYYYTYGTESKRESYDKIMKERKPSTIIITRSPVKRIHCV